MRLIIFTLLIFATVASADEPFRATGEFAAKPTAALEGELRQAENSIRELKEANQRLEAAVAKLEATKAPLPPTPIERPKAVEIDIESVIKKPKMDLSPEPTKTKAVQKPANLMSYPVYTEDGHQVSDAHLIAHGADPALVRSLTPAEKGHLHGMYHTHARTQTRVMTTTPVFTSGNNCVNGVCPNNRMMFRGRRR